MTHPMTMTIYARLDVTFIGLMMARTEVHLIEIQAPNLLLFNTVEVGTAKANVWINPFIVQAGVGVDF